MKQTHLRRVQIEYLCIWTLMIWLDYADSQNDVNNIEHDSSLNDYCKIKSVYSKKKRCKNL